MDKVAADAGYPSRAAFVAHMRTDPEYYAKTPQELLEEAAYTNKQIDDWLPRLIGRLPRLPFSVKPIPPDQAEGTTTAYSECGSVAQGRPGSIASTPPTSTSARVRAAGADAPRGGAGPPDAAIAAAGADPARLPQAHGELHRLRRGLGALRGEPRRGDGLYDTPEKKMGRYSYEMWRACRLVVDTGVHVEGWSRDGRSTRC